MNKKLMALASVAALFAGTAMAADLAPAPAEPVAPVPVAPFTWAGFYAGVNAGASIDDSSISNGLSGSFLTDPNYAAFEQMITAKAHSHKTGFTGGGEVGYNFQLSSFVFGAAADINYADNDLSSTAHLVAGIPLGVVEDLQFRQRPDWFGTVRARAGFALDHFLLYGTGGLAYGGVKSFFSEVEDDGYAWQGRSSKTKVGWTAGAGVEYALTDNWIVGAEYLHVDLGQTTFAVPAIAGGDRSYTMTGKSETEFDVVRATLKYKF